MIALFYLFFIRQAQSGGNQALNFGRSKARRLTDSVPKITFDEVAGVEEAKQELAEIVEFLKNAKKVSGVGRENPQGRSAASDLPAAVKPCWRGRLRGKRASRSSTFRVRILSKCSWAWARAAFRDLFDTAKSNRPSLIFIDEIDAVGRQRGAGLGGGHDEREQTLNQLLVEMDGFDPNAGVIMIAATNRPDVLGSRLYCVPVASTGA